MPLKDAALLAWLQAQPPASGYWLAYSGGRDSHVLLHLLAGLREALPARLQVLHVDHGLQPGSAAWADPRNRSPC